MTMRSSIALIAFFLVAPFAASAAIDTDLRYGSRGEQVKQLQTLLQANGYLRGAITGNFYTVTQNAVKLFQKATSLPQTGTVGPLT